MAKPTDLPAIAQPRSADFLFGAATAAFQIEGATEVDGRLPSIWDVFCATPGKVANGDTGVVACDHFHRWREDVEFISRLGLDAYRLSLAWPRLVTREGCANPKGFDFYKRLLDALGEKGIKRFVTLYHWDLPQWIEECGGWASRESAYRFADYVDLATRELAGRAEAWITLNEPWCSAWLGYGVGLHAPGHTDDTLAMAAGHHLLLGHGLALERIRANDAATPAGIALNLSPATPATDAQADRRAAKLCEVDMNDWFLSPLLRGEYDARLFELHPGSFPAVLPDDLDIISKPMDLLGVNYYTRNVVAADGAHGYKSITLDDVARTDMGWEIYPAGLAELLVSVKAAYPNLPPVYITENGMAAVDQVVDGAIADDDRISYIGSHLSALDNAIAAGVDVRGYFVWSLLDNFEWSFGYAKRFGICYVDYATQKRTPKKSALWYRDFVANRKAIT
jgi:beta-glucosidase